MVLNFCSEITCGGNDTFHVHELFSEAKLIPTDKQGWGRWRIWWDVKDFYLFGFTTSAEQEYAEEIAYICCCSLSGMWLDWSASSAYCRMKMVSFVTFVTACSQRILNKLPWSLYLMGTPYKAEMLWQKTRITATRQRLKITGARTQLFITPVLTPKLFDISLPSMTWALIYQYGIPIKRWENVKGTQICAGLITADHDWRCQKPMQGRWRQ